MKIGKIKALLTAVCCLAASLWSETQGMDNQAGILESSMVNCAAKCTPQPKMTQIHWMLGQN